MRPGPLAQNYKRVVSQMPLENLTMVSFGIAIFETAENSATAGVSLATRNGEGPHGSGVVESVRVLDVSHPAGSWTAQNIDGVTSILQDSGRKLVLCREWR